MDVPLAVLLAVPAALLAYLLSPLVALLVHDRRSPLRLLPGPPSASLVTGNLAQFADQENNDIISTWTRAYGSTFVYRGFVNGRRLLTTDPVALAWILGHAYDFPKPEFIRESLASMAAGHDGLVVVEGETHRRQRKIMSQAFTTPHIKSLLPVFLEKACELRDVFVHIATSASAPPPVAPMPAQDSFALLRSLDPPRPATHELRRRGPRPDADGRPATVDVLAWLGRATLDVIGEAGFGYHFHSLRAGRRALDRPAASDNDDEDELASAFAVIFSTARKFRVFTIFQVWFPFLRRFRPNTKTMSAARATMHRIGTQLIAARRAEALAPAHKGVPARRDILSVLVRAALPASPAAAPGLSEPEVLSQIATFIAAGHETTAAALTWTLYALARSADVQARVRREMRRIAREAAVRENGPSADDAHGDPDADADGALLAAIERNALLERVVREALRLHAPVGSTMRVYAGAADEVAVPVLHGVRVRRRRWCATDEKGWAEEGQGAGAQWTVERAVRLRRGDIITVPIQAVNRSSDIWGEDAREFRPDRWLHPPEAAQAIQGLYANTLTFLNGAPAGGSGGGHRACIGYRFALAEIKIFLYALLRDLEFALDEDVVIEKRVNVVTRPFVKDAPGSGNQMPLRVRVVPQDEDGDARPTPARTI